MTDQEVYRQLQLMPKESADRRRLNLQFLGHMLVCSPIFQVTQLFGYTITVSERDFVDKDEPF